MSHAHARLPAAAISASDQRVKTQQLIKQRWVPVRSCAACLKDLNFLSFEWFVCTSLITSRLRWAFAADVPHAGMCRIDKTHLVL